MAREQFFTLRVNEVELRLIADLAAHLQRTQSDTIRLVVREAAKSLLPKRDSGTPSHFVQGVGHAS